MLLKYSSAAANRILRKIRQIGQAINIASLLLLAGASAAHADPQADEDLDDMAKPWQEVAVQLPAAPKQENLLSFFVSATATQSFAIDAESLSVGADGVVRYILVVTSQAGAKNVSYEGIRCASYERKLYAFGQPDGSWSRSRRNQWERIDAYAANRQHATLFKDYFCTGKSVAGNAEQMIRRLRYHKTLAPQDMQ